MIPRRKRCVPTSLAMTSKHGTLEFLTPFFDRIRLKPGKKESKNVTNNDLKRGTLEFLNSASYSNKH